MRSSGVISWEFHRCCSGHIRIRSSGATPAQDIPRSNCGSWPGELTALFPASQLALFLAAGPVLHFTPGPDMLYVASRSAARGDRPGFRVAGAMYLMYVGARTMRASEVFHRTETWA